MGFNGREGYRGYWVTSWVRDGVPWVVVFEEERSKRALKSWRGAWDVDVGKRWIDEMVGDVVGGDGMDWERLRDVVREETSRAAMATAANEAEFERQRKEQERVKVNVRRSEAIHLIASGMLGLGRLPESAAEVVSAYREQAKVHHPDCGGDAEMMRRIVEAREVLLRWLEQG
jgi:hypothetical protein